MHPLRFRHLSVWFALLAGAVLRLYFIHAFPQIQGDSLMYGDIAKNWLTHGVYGVSAGAGSGGARILPTLIRLPGYPAFLALCFRIFGVENYRAVLYLQGGIDLAGCLLIAGFVGRVCSTRAAILALWLAALCPFTANYVAMPLTETLSIFCVAASLYVFARLLEHPCMPLVFALAAAWSYAALLRPEGALLAVVLFLAFIAYGRGSLGMARALRIAFTCALLAILPFAAWTVRNWRVFHVLQPLVPRLANDPGEFAPRGFDRWTKTWTIDFASTYEIYWNVPGYKLNIDELPSRAFDTSAQYEQTRRLFAEYNMRQALTPQADAGFAELAAERERAHPMRSYVTLPLFRLADMWLRPRVEMLNIELDWWQYAKHHAETGFAVAYGTLNLAYLMAAFAGAFSWPRYRGAMLGYLALHSAALLTVTAPECRYTLECFPIVVAFAGQGLDHWLAWGGNPPG